MAIYPYKVKINGVYYNAGEEVPELNSGASVEKKKTTKKAPAKRKTAEE